MKVKQTYLAEDGTEFDSEEACMSYEDSLEYVASFEAFLRSTGKTDKKIPEYLRVYREFLMYIADGSKANVTEIKAKAGSV